MRKVAQKTRRLQSNNLVDIVHSETPCRILLGSPLKAGLSNRVTVTWPCRGLPQKGEDESVTQRRMAESMRLGD